MLNLPIQNIYNHGKTIYLFNRYGDKLSIMKEQTFKPYFYEEDPTGIFTTIDGKKVKKIFCRFPSEVKRKRTNNSYEADILYTKRFMIDNIGKIIKSNPKYFFIDIETKAPELPNPNNPIYTISCISLYNSLYESIQTWYLNDFEGTEAEREDKLLTLFVNYIKEEQPDILTGWNFIEFDYAYLYARIQKLWNLDFSKLISPIDETRYTKFEFTYPAGISILDYLDLFKKIYKGEVSYALDDIAQKYLDKPPKKKVDFNQVSEEIKIKNIEDVEDMIGIEKLKQIIPYYDEIRRMGKCLWEDLTWYSKVLDVMLLTEAKQKGIVLPSKNYEERESDEKEFEGAYRRCNIEDKEGDVVKKLTGFYKGLWKLDLGGAYPNAIINFCLDISNLTDNKNEHKIDITDRVTNEVLYSIYMKQNPTALLPTLARKLLSKKDILKKKLKSLDPGSSEAKDLQIKYDAIKGLVNSLFGICGLRVFRLYNKNIASAITSIIRDLLHYVEDKLIEKGIEVIYIDTDSLFVKSKENPINLFNQLIKDWAKEKHNKDNVDIEFDCEGIYEKIFILALCHYKGYLKKLDGKIKEETKGIEAKRKDSSKFMKEFQKQLIEKVLNEESKEQLEKFVEEAKEKIKTVPIIELGFPCKVNNTKKYSSPPIFVRALEYTNELIDFKKTPGNTFYYIYVKPFGQAKRISKRRLKNKETGKKELRVSETIVDKNVLAFDEENYQHIKDIDWNKMINKTITKKSKHIFEALDYNEKEIKSKKIKFINKSKEAKNMSEEATIEKVDKRKELTSYYEE